MFIIMNTVDLKTYRNIKDKNPIYENVIKHCKNPIVGLIRSTNIHETCHIISSELRRGKPNVNGFYYPPSQGVIIKQPKITISDISSYIPRNLRGNRYKLYFKDQLKYWNDSPLYIMEEWNCYTMGAWSALIDHQLGNTERTDAVAGTFEFKIYSTALYMCIKDMDKEYDIKEFDNFFFWLSELSFNTFNEGKTIEDFNSKSSNLLFDEFCNSQEGKDFRNFLNEIQRSRSTDYDFKNYL